MSGAINKVILIGNLGDEVKLHYFEENSCVGRFSLATNESFKSKKSGESVVHTEWHKIVVRNKLAEVCEEYLAKGDQIYVEGKIRSRNWNDNGVNKIQTEIHADSIQFLNIHKKTNETASN